MCRVTNIKALSIGAGRWSLSDHEDLWDVNIGLWNIFYPVIIKVECGFFLMKNIAYINTFHTKCDQDLNLLCFSLKMR